jgi:type II secretory pathway pseudopilin PulG
MSILATAKNKAASANVKDAFKNEAGAIDLASIMVGIIVIGLIGGVIAATVFAVIPWAQDNAAKQQLDSVAAAQSAYVGLSADVNGGSQTVFGGGKVTVAAATPFAVTGTPTKTVGNDGVVTEGLFDGSTTSVAIANYGTGSGAHYAAAVKSASGNVYYISDAKTQPTKAAATNPAATNAAASVINTVVTAAKG